VTRITGTSHEDAREFVIISRSFLLRMRNISESCIESQNTRVLCSLFFFSENRAVYERMRKLIVSCWEDVIVRRTKDFSSDIDVLFSCVWAKK